MLSTAAEKARHKRGLRPLSPEQKKLRATGKWHVTVANYPANWSIVSPANSMFLNDTYGDCVLAGEGVNINAHWYFTTGKPVIISDQEIQTYGSNHDILNGADLLQVIGMMSVTNSDGLTYSSGTTNTMYCDGVGSAVNYQNRANLCSAVFSCSGSLKMAVDATPLESIVGSSNGWYLGSTTASNTDHNVEILGYGTAAYCFQALATPIPAGVDPTSFCYLVNTWSTIGVVAAPVIESSGWCSEVDMRTPTSIALVNQPTPAPQPTPQPTPTRRATLLLADLASMVSQLASEYATASPARKAQIDAELGRWESQSRQSKQRLGLAK